MRIISKLIFIVAIVFGVLGIREYIRDAAYAKASIVVKATVISAKVKPNPFKAVGSINLLLSYMRDGVIDSIEHNYTELYSIQHPLPSIETIKGTSYYVRYVPKAQSSVAIPNWFIVSRNEKFEAMYGRTEFGQMANCILLGCIVLLFRKQKKVKPALQ